MSTYHTDHVCGIGPQVPPLMHGILHRAKKPNDIIFHLYLIDKKIHVFDTAIHSNCLYHKNKYRAQSNVHDDR